MDVLVTLPPFLRMKSTSSFILISVPDRVKINVGEPFGSLKRILFSFLLSTGGSLQTTKVVIEVFQGRSSAEDASSTKIFAMRGKVPRRELPADMTEVSVAELLFVSEFGTDLANKVFMMFLGNEQCFELGDFYDALGVRFTGVPVMKGSKCIG
jgi:hypothetical protein